MAGNLTSQVRNIAEVTTAIAQGDLSKKITVAVRGEIQELKTTINSTVDRLNAFASEVTRVAREVGTEGKLGGQAVVPDVAGTWKDLTDSVNFMAGNLTSQVRNVAEVTTAVAKGDLSRKITVDVRGEMLELKGTINTMVDQLNSFASEVTRVAREVGTEGRLGGQAQVPGVAGTWKDLTDSVNSMAGSLTAQVRNIAEVTTAVAKGDLSKKITVDVRGEVLELKGTINVMVDQLNAFASEVTRVAREVGSEGILGGQAQVPGVAGTWKDLTDSVNTMAFNLTNQVRNIARVTTAVANGDLSKKVTVDVRGEMLELKDTINTMVDQLNGFASEVTRVAREVGSEGKLGGQAQVPGVGGVWKDLTDSVNSMAGNLTNQVRGIAKVVTSVANGDLKRKLLLEAKGEIEELAETINTMIDTLATFADQVTTVAREVGFEGILGGQAEVPGAAGLWRDLTDSVNQLAAQLTSQIRAIGEVATAVTKGDLSRTIEVSARGEVGQLTENVNEMIRNLRDTTRKNTEQDWLKTNLARFTGMLQGQKDIKTVAKMIMSELAPLVEGQTGVFYLNEPVDDQPLLKLIAGYAYTTRKHLKQHFTSGEGLVGQCLYERERILVTNAPPDYIEISSGLGASRPAQHRRSAGALRRRSSRRHRARELPKVQRDPLALPRPAHRVDRRRFEQYRDEHAYGRAAQAVAIADRRAAEPTGRAPAHERGAGRKSPPALRAKRRSRDAERAKSIRRAKSSSKRPSSLRSPRNTSHSSWRTCRTSCARRSTRCSCSPNNSRTIRGQNLTAKQVEFAQSIRRAGIDLLDLINDILDLSKIESGMTPVEIGPMPFADIVENVERTFRSIAQDRGLAFTRSARGRFAGKHRDRQRASDASSQEPALQRVQVHAGRRGDAQRHAPNAGRCERQRDSVG